MATDDIINKYLGVETEDSKTESKPPAVVRKDDKGNIVTEGSKVVVGGNDIYMPVCRKHYRKLTKLI